MLFGALAAAALPPVHALPLLLPAFIGLIWMLRGQPSGRLAFMLGFWFGFGHHVAGLYWLAWPMTLDLARFGWMIPFAVFGMSALLALFVGGATLAAYLTRLRGIGLILVLAVAWAGFELLRAFVLTGFPWNLLATSWVILDHPMQIASAIGPYGLGLITVVVAGLPAALGFQNLRRAAGAGATAAGALLLAAMFGVGWARLPAGDTGVVKNVPSAPGPGPRAAEPEVGRRGPGKVLQPIH